MDYLEVSSSSSWKDVFFTNTFSVDQCLSEFTQKSDLETIRKDLRSYGNELQLHMSDILKNETEAIVNLAEYLTNLNAKINNLSVPISQLREEIRTLHDLMKDAEHSYSVVLSTIKSNDSHQNHVHLKLGILNSSLYINLVMNTIDTGVIENLLTLERIVSKYSFQKTYLDELNLVTKDIEKVVYQIEEKLVQNVNKCFLKAFDNSDKDTLLRCLRMYSDLRKQEEAHKIFQLHIIKPSLQPLLTEKYLEKCGHDLEKIYVKVKEILDTKVDILQSLVNAHPDLNCFNFIVKSLWKEFDVQSREGLPNITAPGNPELFQKRFTSTYNLFKHIALKANQKELVKQDETFQLHLKRFNLHVYFEIKFQQIAGNFESDTINLKLDNIESKESSFKLQPSTVLWRSVTACFSEEVYIDQLADHFIKLTMLLISRYTNFLEKLLESVSGDLHKLEVEVFIVSALIDFSTLIKSLAPSDNIEKTIFAPINPSMWYVLSKVFKVHEKSILKTRSVFMSQLAGAKIAACIGQLQNVTAIPRLYRRTNRNPPKEASLYMVEAVKPILAFEDRFKANLSEIREIMDTVIRQVTNQYLSLVQEVLTSVRKIEESLRRFKSRNVNVSFDEPRGSPDTMSDEAKIREQIKYDVGYFCDKLYPLGSKSAKDAMDFLKKEVFM